MRTPRLATAAALLAVLVDLSHTSDGTMSDALRMTQAPVIFSHSSARALTDHRHNVPDSILAKMPRNGGVVLVTLVGSFISQAVKDHDDARAAERVRRVAGIDHVGLGGDFDGTTDLPVGLEDVSKYPALFTELARRGWTETDPAKLAGGNILRVLGDAERVAARLQRERPASTATIEALDGARKTTKTATR